MKKISWQVCILNLSKLAVLINNNYGIYYSSFFEMVHFFNKMGRICFKTYIFNLSAKKNGNLYKT